MTDAELCYKLKHTARVVLLTGAVRCGAVRWAGGKRVAAAAATHDQPAREHSTSDRRKIFFSLRPTAGSASSSRHDWIRSSILAIAFLASQLMAVHYDTASLTSAP